MKRFSLGVLGFVAALAMAPPANAELIRITPLGLPSPGYEEAGYEVSPVLIGGDGFRLTFHSGSVSSSTFLLDPLIIIFGVPNTDPTSTPPLSGPLDSEPEDYSVDISHGDDPDNDDIIAYGGKWDTSDGFAGVFDASAQQNSVYELIGFAPDGSDSQNYTNWNGATGLTSWDLYVYVLTLTPDLVKGGWVEFETDLPTGSYVIGYGCTQFSRASTSTEELCKNSGTTQSTPFTFAGLVTREVPEPSSLSLLVAGTGLMFARRRTNARKA